MAVKIQYLEPGVVHVRWIDKVTIDELDVAVNEVDAAIAEAGDPVYLEIIDLRECSAIPFDLRGLRRIATHDSRIVGYIAVQPTHIARTMANMLVQVTGLPFRLVSTWDQAVNEARAMLKKQMARL